MWLVAPWSIVRWGRSVVKVVDSHVCVLPGDLCVVVVRGTLKLIVVIVAVLLGFIVVAVVIVVVIVVAIVVAIVVVVALTVGKVPV